MQAELLVIDEAAAIPLPLVKAMLGPYLVFLCSTGGWVRLLGSVCSIHACKAGQARTGSVAAACPSSSSSSCALLLTTNAFFRSLL